MPYRCPICGYTHKSRLKASSHLVNGHLEWREADELDGEEGYFGYWGVTDLVEAD